MTQKTRCDTEESERRSRGDYWCKHRTPFNKDEFPVCEAGIDYHQFMPMNPDMPCLGETEAGKARCSGYEGYTPEELLERRRRFDERFDNMCKVRAAIVARVQETKLCAGTIPCPVCGETVHYTQASNGHIHAGCTNDKCVRWME